jgi:RNAse (barnase) inhibitor barstar
MIMSKAGLRQIRLSPDHLADREKTALFLKQQLGLPDWFNGNLDALADLLGEVSEETVFEVEADQAERFEAAGYPAKVLRVISDVSKDNPAVHLYLTQRGDLSGKQPGDQ